jgi:16S rRNA processing protein RimM
MLRATRLGRAASGEEPCGTSLRCRVESFRLCRVRCIMPDVTNHDVPAAAAVAPGDGAALPGANNVLAAQVTGAHGVSGNVRLRLVGANSSVAAEALRNATSILAQRDDGVFQKQLDLISLKKQVQPKGGWIARFKGVTDRPRAEELYGCSLLVTEQALPRLPDGEYYVDQLVGCGVVTDAGRSLGDLVEILNAPAHDVYVTSAGAMIPAVAAFVRSVSVDTRTIVVADVPGLLDS